jgi:hypothetical protein
VFSYQAYRIGGRLPRPEPASVKSFSTGIKHSQSPRHRPPELQGSPWMFPLKVELEFIFTASSQEHFIGNQPGRYLR